MAAGWKNEWCCALFVRKLLFRVEVSPTFSTSGSLAHEESNKQCDSLFAHGCAPSLHGFERVNLMLRRFANTFCQFAYILQTRTVPSRKIRHGQVLLFGNKIVLRLIFETWEKAILSHLFRNVTPCTNDTRHGVRSFRYKSIRRIEVVSRHRQSWFDTRRKWIRYNSTLMFSTV